MWKIRSADAGDAAALSRLADGTFRVAFQASASSQDMDLHCARSYSSEIQAAEIVDPNLHTIVADCAGELTGYAQLRRGPKPDCVSGNEPLELRRVYVLSRWQGSGLAQDLMVEVFSWARSRQADSLWLGVWENNVRAMRFYRKLGFEVVGAQLFVLGTDPQRDLVMRVGLPPTSPPPRAPLPSVV